MTATARKTPLSDCAALFRQPGPWCSVYIDASTGTVDSLRAHDVIPDNVHDELQRAGASKADLAAVDEALRESSKGLPDPVSQVLLVRGGEVVLNERFHGHMVMAPFVRVGEVPELVPLLRHRPEQFAYVVAEVSRDGGEVRLAYAGTTAAGRSVEVEGSTENLKKIPGGGWSQGRVQHRTENIWKVNASEVAAEIDRVVYEVHPKLVIIAGDVRARHLVRDQLAKESAAVASVIESHTRTGGADHHEFDHQVESLVAQKLAEVQEELLDRLRMQEGQANPRAATGIGAVVTALQQAQVDILMVQASQWQDSTLLALDAEPWVATSDGERAGAGVLGEVPAQSALVRAAALTDARVLFLPDGVLDKEESVSALLRWSSGPGAPES